MLENRLYFYKYVLVLVSFLFCDVALPQNNESKDKPAFPFENHLDQFDLPSTDIGTLIDWGGKLFNTEYNSLDGAGSNLSMDEQGTIKFTRFPRMDLPGFAANPTRTTGPNSLSCVSCHSVPFPGGGGAMHDMEIRDPFRSGDPNQYVQRNPLHLFGSGALQLLAEQTTQELFLIRKSALEEAGVKGSSVTKKLITSNGINYGSITVTPAGDVDTTEVIGITSDLIVRPYTYKGSFVTFLRPLVSLGADTQMGMPTVEFFGADTDFDFDGHVNEMTVGDITAMTLYIASLPRPVSQLELSRFVGGKHSLSRNEKRKIRQGKRLFSEIGCASCHKPKLKIENPVFSEPSSLPMHRFPMFPSGQDPITTGLDPNNPVLVDLALNPRIGNKPNTKQCRRIAKFYSGYGRKYQPRWLQNCFLQYRTDERDGGVTVSLYGDLKWHDMGPGLAENVDEAGTGRSVWKTRELWGVGNTGPWLHDGRATSLHEAIMWHGGEAQSSYEKYAKLSEAEQGNIVRFLENLVLYLPERPKKR